jgi:hypothetical protein
MIEILYFVVVLLLLPYVKRACSTYRFVSIGESDSCLVPCVENLYPQWQMFHFL